MSHYCKILLGDPSKPDHIFRTGDKLISARISLNVDENASNCEFTVDDTGGKLAEKYFTFIYENKFEPPLIDLSRIRRIGDIKPVDAVQSIADTKGASVQRETINPNVKAGQQISIELGINGTPLIRFAVINDGISYNQNNRQFSFSGIAATRILADTIKNTAYSNLTFTELASIICGNYGLTAEFTEVKNNPFYEYIPQVGLSDYQFLVYEAKRIGYRVTSQNAKMIFNPTVVVQANVFTLEYAVNMLDANFSFTADAVGTEGLRDSVKASDSTQQNRKWKINDSGFLEATRQEIEQVQTNTQATTGSAIAKVEPAVVNDTGAVENNLRTKGLELSFNCLFDNASALLDPSTSGIIVKGVNTVLDRVFILENVDFDYRDNNTNVTGRAYSPLKPKYEDIPQPTQSIDFATPGNIPVSLTGSVNEKLIATYRRLGNFETRSVASRYGISPNVACVAAINYLYQQAGLTPLWGNALNVAAARNALRTQGRPLRLAEMIPGDIHVVLRSDGFAGHIGLYLGNGRVISNSSSRAAFVWNSPLGFPPSYSGAPISEVYRDSR